MRLEAVNSEVSCGSIAAVRIYLDDLVPRESTTTPGVSAGMVGFQATLQYDPDVLRILGGSDVQINSDLGLQDADGDGIVRSFLPSMFLEDHLGRAVVGGISYVPSSQGPADNLEEGVDPVAKGEPLLLVTVRFTPVGQGTTTVRNAGWDGRDARVDPQVFDVEGESYEPLRVEDTEITVRGGDCLPPPPSPTTQPTSTPIVVPTRVIPTPVEYSPTPATQGGRDDCPTDWDVYRDLDEHFSVCFPSGTRAVVSPPDADLGATITLDLPGGSMTMYWRQSSYFGSDTSLDRCDLAPAWEDKQEVTKVIAGRSVLACVGYELLRPSGSPPLLSTFAEVPVGGDRGYLTVFFVEPEGTEYADERQAVKGVLDSVKLDVQ